MKKIIFLALILLTSCKLYDVSSSAENKGIPFFSHEIIEVITETYQEKFYEVKAEIIRGELNATAPETKTKSKVITQPKKEEGEKSNDVLSTILYYSDESTAIKLNNIVGVEDLSFRAKITAFNQTTFYNPKYREKPFPFRDMLDNKERTETQKDTEQTQEKSKTKEDLDLLLISKTRMNRVQPSSKKHYINVRKAASGTTDGTITLNANGTLASAAVSTSEELIGQIIEALPIGDVLSSVLIPSDEEIEEMLSDTIQESTPKTKKLPVKSFKLTLTPIIRTYEVTEENSLNETDNKLFKGLKITETRGDTAKPEEKAKDDDKEEIKLSGNITLPKAKENK